MRTVLLSLLLSTVLFGKESIEVFASEVKATTDHFEASGDVIILYDGAMLKSNHATYDKNSSRLILNGDVEMLSETENRVSSNELILNTSTKDVEFKKVFLSTEENLWIDAQKATKRGENYKIFDSKLSSCNKANPDWTIRFSEAYYRKDKNFITLKDAELVFFNRKIISLPFMAFPTIDERTTGILYPKFKLSDTEGLTYAQPYYYAPTNNIDVEFNPQIRTHRGFGTHITTRFVDSNHSSGEFTTGYFKNFDSYSSKNHLNKEHYGFEFLYKSVDFLPLDEYQSGLYANTTYLNDLEYLNTQKNSASSLINSNLVESRFNAFAYDDNDYFGFYAKYYIDTSKESNTKTIQELPTLHYHRFMDRFLVDKLFYTVDARVHNYSRVKGSRANQFELDVPITYYDSFFNDYLDFSLSENLYLTQVNFSNLNHSSDNYRYYRNFHTMELSSDLMKKDEDYVHTIHPSIVYTKPSFENENPLKYSDLEEEQKELFVTQTKKENVSFGLSQDYFNGDLEMNFYHRLAWIHYPKEKLNRGDVNNEIGYKGKNLSLYSNLFYSLDKDKIHSLTTSLGYNQSNYDIMFTHFYNNDFEVSQDKTSFINTALTHNYNKHNQWFMSYDYDLDKSFNHQWQIGWTHKQKCWGAKLSLGQERIPNVDSFFRNNMLYFELNLNPLGGISQNIEQKFSSEGK